MRTVIYGGLLARYNGVLRADVAFEDGRVVELGESLPRDGADAVNAEGCIVMPGGVDAHTHFTFTARVGDTRCEVSDGMYAGTLAAACGGTTCVVEHPSFGPEGCSLLERPAAVRAAAGEAVVDYGVHTVFQPGQDLAEVPLAAAQGYASGKVYLAEAGMLQDGQAARVLDAMRDAHCLTAVHCENDAMIRWLAARFTARGETGVEKYPQARPPQCEEEAVFRMLALGGVVGAPLYVAHVSTAAALRHITAARRAGGLVWAETCPQFLLLDEICYGEGAAEGLKYVTAPALRSPRDATALWEGLKSGMLDVVASDHCSFTFADKWRVSEGNVFRCPEGIPGVETRIPLLFSEGVLKSRLTLPRFVQVAAEAPARLMGLERKGDIAPGYDADVVIMDPSVERSLTAGRLHQATDYTPFEGIVVRGWPRDVWVRGQAVVRKERFVGEKGCGRFVARCRA